MEPTTPAAAPAPAPASPAPAAPATGYESNPFKLLSPTWKALKLVFWPLVITFLVSIVPIGILAAILITGIASGNKSLGLIGFILGAIIVLAFLFIFPGIYALLLNAGAKGQKNDIQRSL